MTNINITDLFGNSIVANNVPFILIHINEPMKYISRLDNKGHMFENESTDSIWDVDILKIFADIKQFPIPLDNIVKLGHLWFPYPIIHQSITVLCGNTTTNFFYNATSYIFVSSYKNGNLWKPISPNKDHSPISLIFSLSSPNNSATIVSNKLLIPYNGDYNIVNNATNFNEFNFVSTTDIMRLTINRTKLLNDTKRLAIIKNNKFLRNINNIPRLDDIESGVTYSVQGELKLNGKCLGVPMGYTRKNKTVDLQDCTNEINQKWFVFDDHIISQFDKTCLVERDNNVFRDSCKQNSNSQIWNVQHTKCQNKKDAIDNDACNVMEFGKNIKDVHEKWYNSNKRHVVLTESNNPWYINLNNETVPTVADKSNVDFDDIYDGIDNDTVSIAKKNVNQIGGKIKIKRHYFCITVCIIVLIFIFVIANRNKMQKYR